MWQNSAMGVAAMAELLPNEAVWRLIGLRVAESQVAESGGDRSPPARVLPTAPLATAHAALVALWADDLAGALNACWASELAHVGAKLGMTPPGVGELRLALWRRLCGEALGGERGVRLIGQRLVVMAPMLGVGSHDGLAPVELPRFIEAPAALDHPEPDTLDELLARAAALIGVRLGPRGRDKGAWGNRVAALLGIPERGDDEPDWRGDVEVKTVPVATDGAGHWRVLEDPAICTEDVVPWRKLARVLWLCRVTLPDGDAAIVAWYYVENGPMVEPLLAGALHQRPKGPAGTTQKGHYVRKRFFSDVGLIAMLCGGASATLPQAR